MINEESTTRVPAGWGPGAGILRNPHRGYRFEMNYRLPDLSSPWPNEIDDPVDPHARLGIMRSTYGDDPAVSQLYFYLGHYIEQPIPDAQMAQIREVMSAYRSEGVSVVLRFAYDHSFLPQVPYTAAGAVAHIRQLAPLVAEFADMVTVWQAGFFGRWGEWGYSFHPLSTDPSAVNAVAGALVEALPPGVRSQVRYEAKWSLIAPELRDAFGYHNDYLTLQGDMDLIDPQYDTWQHYLDVSEHHPMDYELGWDSIQDVDDYPWDEILDGVAAARRLQTMRVDTFSIVHNTNRTIAAWREQTVSAEDLAKAGLPVGREWFGGEQTRSAYDYIRDHLGFRIEVDEIASRTVDGGIQVDITVVNRGFAEPKRPMRARLLAQTANGETLGAIDLDTDWRTWTPSGRSELDDHSAAARIHLSALVPVPADSRSDLRIGLVWEDLTGSRRFAPRVANADIRYDDGVNILIE